jgi:hypothetical protein
MDSLAVARHWIISTKPMSSLRPVRSTQRPARARRWRQLDTGHIKATAKVAENLYRKATGEGREAVIAAIFWLKTPAGWKETSVTELAAAKGSEPVTMIVRQIVEPVRRPEDVLDLTAVEMPRRLPAIEPAS